MFNRLNSVTIGSQSSPKHKARDSSYIILSTVEDEEEVLEIRSSESATLNGLMGHLITFTSLHGYPNTTKAVANATIRLSGS